MSQRERIVHSYMDLLATILVNGGIFPKVMELTHQRVNPKQVNDEIAAWCKENPHLVVAAMEALIWAWAAKEDPDLADDEEAPVGSTPD